MHLLMSGAMIWLVTFLGGGIGAVSRQAVSHFAAVQFGESFPYGTLIANVSGCFLIGLADALLGADSKLASTAEVRQFFMIGVLGGYTTFSSFSLQTLNLMRDGEWVAVSANVAGSVVLCLFGVFLGFAAGAWLNQSR